MPYLQTPQFLQDRGITEIATLDFETFYSKDYTLRKMSTSLYIFDELFLVHGLGININGNTFYYDTEAKIKKALANIDWSKTALLCHHTQFDALILFYHYGIKPAYYLDTLSMARPVLQNVLKKLDLDSIAKHFKIQGKLDGLEDTKGKRSLTPIESVRLGIYCKNDVDITIPVFNHLAVHITEMEMDVIHYTVKMYADPKLQVDDKLIMQEIQDIIKHKNEMFDKAHDMFPAHLKNEKTIQVLRSGVKFAQVLEHNGIAVPMKISKTTGKETYAFAKNDLDFQKIGLSNNPDAVLLHNARITSKSDTALNKALMLKQFAEAACCPAYLNYWKANTGRWTGGDKLQLQNLPRKGNARLSLLAPKGHVLLVCDLSQVELRMSAWFAGQQDVLDIFASGKDVYKDMATKLYNVDYKEVTKDQRMVAKVTCLGLGYGAGVPTFENMLKAGAMGPKIDLGTSKVTDIHRKYRHANNMIVKTWVKAGTWLHSLNRDGDVEPVEYKGLIFEPERVRLPGGTILNYHNLRFDEYSDAMYNGANGMTKRIYSSLFYENLIQALARNVIAEHLVNIAKHYDVVLSVHDELLMAIPENEIEAAQTLVEKIMRTSPDWCKDLPLDCESGWALNYSK